MRLAFREALCPLPCRQPGLGSAAPPRPALSGEPPRPAGRKASGFPSVPQRHSPQNSCGSWPLSALGGEGQPRRQVSLKSRRPPPRHSPASVVRRGIRQP